MKKFPDMDLRNLLQMAGAEGSLGAVLGKAGIPAGDAGKLLASLSPALTQGIQKQAASTTGLAGFIKALQSGGHQRYVDEPQALDTDDARLDGNKILGHLFGSKEVSRDVARQAESETGIAAVAIKKALPLLAGLVMGAISKSSDAGKNLQSGADGGLGALGGLFKGKDGGAGLDDVIAMARKIF